MLINNLDYLNSVGKQSAIAGSRAFTSANAFVWGSQSTAMANAVATGVQTFTATDTYATNYSTRYVSAGDAGAYGVAQSLTRYDISLSISVDVATDVSLY